jgi:hypothetical protein
MHNFCKPGHAKNLWQQILSHWSHRDRPAGQRFLGSVQISQTETNEVLDVVSNNLRQISKITYDNLHERFNEREKNWLKILTFALSEYAYYYSSQDVGFWEGFCQRLNLCYTPSQEDALRQVVGEGFDLLGIVKAKGGYRYVSTLWLQSGIPHRNINHFAELVEKFSDEYGWWEIAHASAEDISQELLGFCQEKHREWGTLINFLKSSCSEQNEVEPLSGQLVQGIAFVAQAIEHQGVSAEVLKNEQEREKLLRNYYLPQSFFLRNWETLIQVLTPKENSPKNSQKIRSRRSQPLSLVLDIFDSLNIQLVLPEQSLWKSEWQCLGGTFCKIPEARWEGNISTSGEVTICTEPVNVRTVEEEWIWQLLDHQGNCLLEWKLEGIASDFPCLIFDAWTGDRIPLDSDNSTSTIGVSKEIICFTPQNVYLDFGNEIEIIDSCVPSSLSGWQGQQLRLTAKESSIHLIGKRGKGNHTFKTILWKPCSDQQPCLRGLKLKGKKSIYLEIPTFWYPPSEEELSLKVSIENITHKTTLITTNEVVQSNKTWQAIPLNRWITEPGKYEARFWNQSHHWSYQFEIQADYQIVDSTEITKIRIIHDQKLIENLPISTNDANRFWSEELKIEGLSPLEAIGLSLWDDQETVVSQAQADERGLLHISLATFYDLLCRDSNRYSLDLQRLGQQPQRLIEMAAAHPEITRTWHHQAVQLSGLLPDTLYSLSCWNLLLPENSPVKIKNIPIVFSPTDTISVSLLELPPGIYHIQLLGARKPKNLGWWCGSSQNDLPNKALKNDRLEDYCYTILGNESVDDFVKAAAHFNYDLDLLKIAIRSLKKVRCYLPEWLPSHDLLEKLQALVKKIEEDKSGSAEVFQPIPTENNQNTQKTWLLIKVNNSSKFKKTCQRIRKIFVEKRLRKSDVSQTPHIPRQISGILLLEFNNENIIDCCINELRSISTIQSIQALTFNEAQTYLRA